MKSLIVAAALLLNGCAALPEKPAPVAYAAVLADPVRPAADRARDAARKPAEMLANPADPRTANVFDSSIRGRTDQFALKFRKPRG